MQNPLPVVVFLFIDEFGICNKCEEEEHENGDDAMSFHLVISLPLVLFSLTLFIS